MESKGKYNGICRRTACDNERAVGFNLSTREFYCVPCSQTINAQNRVDAERLYGDSRLVHFIRPLDEDDSAPAKGEFLGECKRSACSNPNAFYVNKSTRAHYCADCAREINQFQPKESLEDLGVLCVIAHDLNESNEILKTC